MKLIIVFISIFLIVGCPTSYQKGGLFNGTAGYIDKEISVGKYFLISRVNASTEPKLATSYWHRRAEELCGHSKYKADLKFGTDLFENEEYVSKKINWTEVTGIVYCDWRSNNVNQSKN